MAAEKPQERPDQGEERRVKKPASSNDQNSQTELDFLTIDQVFHVAQKSLAAEAVHNSRNDGSPANPM